MTTSSKKPKETTARFTTEECKRLRRAVEIALTDDELPAVEVAFYHKILKRLEDRINKEARKNEIGTANPTGA